MPSRTLRLSHALNIKESSGGTHGRASRAFQKAGGRRDREKRRVVVLGKSRAMVIFPLADVQNHASPRPPTVVSYRHSFLPSVVLAPASSALPATRTYARTHANIRVRANLEMRGRERGIEKKRERDR